MKAPATLLVLTALVMSSGCGPSPSHYWYHPHKTLKEAKADYCECEDRAKEVREERADAKSASTRSSDDDWEFYQQHAKSRSNLEAMYEKNIFEGCMQGKGYIKVQDYHLPSNLRTKDYSTGGVAGR